MAQGIYRESTNPKNQIESPHRHVPPPFRGLLLLRGGRRRRRLVSVSSAPVAVGAVHRGPLEEHEIVPAGSGPAVEEAADAAAAAARRGRRAPVLAPLPDGPRERRRGAVAGRGAPEPRAHALHGERSSSLAVTAAAAAGGDRRRGG